MSSFLDKLNLRPQERRLVVIVAVVVFVVLNFWLVFPKFGELGIVQQRIRDTQATLEKYRQEVNRKEDYDKELANLQAMGFYIPSEERALQLQRDVSAQAGINHVSINRVDSVKSTLLRTNAFFEDQSVIVNVGTTLEKDLVNFLYSLGKRDSLTRVKNMDLRPDPTRIYLSGSLTVVRSFQRKVTGRSSAAPKPVTPNAESAEAPKPASAAPAPAPAPAIVADPATPSPSPARELPKRAAPQPIKKP